MPVKLPTLRPHMFDATLIVRQSFEFEGLTVVEVSFLIEVIVE